MPSIRIVQAQVEALAEELTKSLDFYSSFDGRGEVLGRILDGEHGVETSLSGQLEIDVVLADVVKTAIRQAESRGRIKGRRDEQQRIARTLGLID